MPGCYRPIDGGLSLGGGWVVVFLEVFAKLGLFLPWFSRITLSHSVFFGILHDPCRASHHVHRVLVKNLSSWE